MRAALIRPTSTVTAQKAGLSIIHIMQSDHPQYAGCDSKKNFVLCIYAGVYVRPLAKGPKVHKYFNDIVDLYKLVQIDPRTAAVRKQTVWESTHSADTVAVM